MPTRSRSANAMSKISKALIIIIMMAITSSTNAGQDELSFEQVVQMANDGNVTAQVAAGEMLFAGDMVNKDLDQAIKWFSLAAEKNDDLALFYLGKIYFTGDGVPKNEIKAAELITSSAEQGNENAKLLLATMYHLGKGVPQDYSAAKNLFLELAEKGNYAAQLNLGIMYYAGRGFLQDRAYAHMWVNIAASFGSEKAKDFRDSLSQEMTTNELAFAQQLARECVAKKYKNC